MNIANSAWAQQGFPFREAYLDLLAGQYGTGLYTANFAENSDGARRQINNWVAEQTHDRIEELLPSGSIRPTTRLVLANAIYFKASWLNQFYESQTKEGQFTLLDGSQIIVPLMQQENHFPYLVGEGYQAVQLPYIDQSVDMLLFLPDAGNYEAIESQLSPEFLEEVRQTLETDKITLVMPHFDFKSSLDLKELLQAMGLSNPFEPSANFSGISERGMFIDEALHQGSITVD